MDEVSLLKIFQALNPAVLSQVPAYAPVITVANGTEPNVQVVQWDANGLQFIGLEFEIRRKE